MSSEIFSIDMIFLWFVLFLIFCCNEQYLQVKVQNGLVEGRRISNTLNSWNGISSLKPSIGRLELEETSLKVEVQNGWVKGVKLADSLYSWRGIPYAKPPIGNLRFEPPEVPDNWTNTWDATHDRSQCIVVMTDDLDSVIHPKGNEDCLYINVYAPRPPIRNNSLLSVMVWFHGGAFFQGNSSYNLFGPYHLVKEDVIVVTFNYRLGIFGFLSTDDKAAPGNTGLKDQIFALKWIKRNIQAFGGDPNKLTIFGESAGAVSISYMILSPLTKGLYHRAILESGSALCSWSLSKTARKAAFETGVLLGIVNRNSEDLVSGLKRISAYDLQRASIVVMGSILGRDTLNGLVYAPVIEPPNDNAVITDYSYEKLKRGDFNRVPQMIGYNSAEAFLFNDLIQLLSLYITKYDIIPRYLVPESMNANTSDKESIGIRIRNYYADVSGTLAFPNSHFEKYLTDDQFVRSIQQTANLTSQYVNTYMYKFSYTHNSKQPGAAHADELQYIFNSDYNNTSDKFIRRCMAKLWTNFAKFSNPTPTNFSDCGEINWKPIQPDNRNTFYCINIDRKTTSCENPEKARMEFWRKLFKEYGNPPFKTY